MSLTAVIGSFELTATEGVIPGTDTGWNRKQSVQRTRARGAVTDSILNLAVGSRERSFTLQLSQARARDLQDLQGALISFTDWSGLTTNAYIEDVGIQTSSRPHLALVNVSLVEQ